jgi:hypothetical protein
MKKMRTEKNAYPLMMVGIWIVYLPGHGKSGKVSVKTSR